MICVGPDPSEPLDHDVQAAFSDAVTVKSKRNKVRFGWRGWGGVGG